MLQQYLKLWRALLLIAGHIVSYNVLQFLKAITAKVNKQNKGGMVQRSGHEGSAVISCMTSALMLESGSEEIKPCPVQPVWGSLEREKEFGDVWGYAHWLLVQGHGRPKHCQVPCQKLPVDLRERTDWKPIFWLANQRNTDAESCQIWARRACISESNFTMFMTFMDVYDMSFHHFHSSTEWQVELPDPWQDDWESAQNWHSRRPK